MARIPNSNIKTGPVKGHIRKGRRYSPPLVATGLLEVGDWQRTDLPDYIWPILLVHLQGEKAVRRFVLWQKELLDVIDQDEERRTFAKLLDGRLSSLDLLVNESEERRSVVRSAAERAGLLPEALRQTLVIYPEIPARWLFDSGENLEDIEADFAVLHDAIVGILKSGHREALIKCLGIWAAVQGGTFSSDAATIELLKDYPLDIAKRGQADSIIRAGWGAQRRLAEIENAARFEKATEWARLFWGVNSTLTPCVRSRDVEVMDNLENSSRPNGEGDRSKNEDQARTSSNHGLATYVEDLLSSFIEALDKSALDQCKRECLEVNAGLVSRAGRELIAVLESPMLWGLEYGSHTTRMLIETKIYVKWMSLQDLSIYKEFQEYGFGKAKLYRAVLEETPDEARPPGFEAGLNEFAKLSRNSEVLDYRVIDTRDTFAGGKSIRKMAEESGLFDLYSKGYAIASGVAHSEWWSIESHAMEECLNALHGGHLVPSLTLNTGGSEEIANSWIQMFWSILQDALDILPLNQEAVSVAFSWLLADDE